MEYLSKLVSKATKKRAIDAGSFYKEVSAIDGLIYEIERKIGQHEDPNSLRHDDLANALGDSPEALPPYRPETLAKLKVAIETLRKAKEQATEVGRLFSYDYEYEDDFLNNFKG